jgi:intein/homing endonuclease
MPEGRKGGIRSLYETYKSGGYNRENRRSDKGDGVRSSQWNVRQILTDEFKKCFVLTYTKYRRNCMGETSKIREIAAKYCVGKGVDLGCGADKIVPEAWGFDLPEPYSIDGNDRPEMKGDARVLPFNDGVLDYVYCVVPGENSLVNTISGYKNIEEVKKGDKVLDFNGEYSKVLSVYENNHRGDIITVQVEGLPSLLKFTPEHTLPVKRGDEIVWVRAASINVTDHLIIPIIRHPSNCKTTVRIIDVINGEREKLYSKSIGLKKAGKTITEIKDELKLPRTTVWQWYAGKKTPYDVFKESEGWVVGSGQTKVKNEIAIDRDFMKLTGYYLSDGCAHKRKAGATVEFYFHSSESEYADDVKRIMFEKFGIMPIKRGVEKTKIIRVRYCSAILCKFFKEFMSYPHKKDIPPWAILQNRVNLTGLVEGLFRGDGTWNDTNASFSSKDRDMVLKLRDILLRLGIRSKINLIDSSKYKPTIRGRQIKSGKLYTLRVTGDFDRLSVILKTSIKDKRFTHNTTFIQDNKYFVRIKKIELKSYAGKTYNLEVGSKNQNSYTVNGIAVHNSSHLLEDFPNTDDAVNEWLRVLKPGGKLILYMPNEQKYRKHCDATGQVYNLHHTIAEMSLDYMKEVFFPKSVKIIDSIEEHADYSFFIVVEKVQNGE